MSFPHFSEITQLWLKPYSTPHPKIKHLLKTPHIVVSSCCCQVCLGNSYNDSLLFQLRCGIKSIDSAKPKASVLTPLCLYVRNLCVGSCVILQSFACFDTYTIIHSGWFIDVMQGTGGIHLGHACDLIWGAVVPKGHKVLFVSKAPLETTELWNLHSNRLWKIGENCKAINNIVLSPLAHCIMITCDN